MKFVVFFVLLVLLLLGGCGDLLLDGKVVFGLLVLYCGDFGKFEVIDGFVSFKLFDGSSVQLLGGDVCSFVDGQVLSVIFYSDGLVLYCQVGDMFGYLYMLVKGQWQVCEMC